MLQPKRIKHRKVHKRAARGTATRGYYLSFGSYGLKSLEAYWLKGSQIESARRAIAHSIQRGGKLWIRVFPDKPRSQKGAETGMGGGAGGLSHFVAPVEAGFAFASNAASRGIFLWTGFGSERVGDRAAGAGGFWPSRSCADSAG